MLGGKAPLPPPMSKGKGKAKSDPVAAGVLGGPRGQGGEVTGGFSRDEILRPHKEAPGQRGRFSGSTGLLRELSAGGQVR